MIAGGGGCLSGGLCGDLWRNEKSLCPVGHRGLEQVEGGLYHGSSSVQILHAGWFGQ